jgi:flagellar biosynthesis activator protein FlaF
MSLKAYQKAQVAVENPRTTEYRLFGQITGALMDAKTSGAKGPPLVDVIDRNRRLWSVLAGDCVSEGNQLPKELRAQIVSLAIWVSKYSTDVMHKGASIDPLIDINRNIMQGLKSAA